MISKDKKNILLVEDNKMIQFATRMMLESFPCHVDSVETGKQALEICKRNSYDLIIMDIGLPDMQGIFVTKFLRKEQNYKYVPIIVLSAHTDKKLKEQCKNAGINEYLVKPLTNENIKNLIVKYF